MTDLTPITSRPVDAVAAVRRWAISEDMTPEDWAEVRAAVDIGEQPGGDGG